MAVVALNQDFIGHWIVSSNNRITHLCDDARKQNDWLTQHHHGLDWTDTCVSEKVLYKNLEEICKSSDKIYVRGNVKSIVLQKITTRNIKNLETDADCPPFHKLLSSSKYCVQHFIKSNYFKYACAVNNAFIQIQKILMRISPDTVGVFPADQISLTWSRPAAYVFNTQKHNRPGLHWVAIYVDKIGNGCYFDSFGKPPYILDHINRIRRNVRKFRWNPYQLQSKNAGTCGYYCIMFLHYMSVGVGFRRFLQCFSTDLEKNDQIVRNYVSQLQRSIFAYHQKYPPLQLSPPQT